MAPRAAAALSTAASGSARGGHRILRATWSARRSLFRGVYRLMWWAALAMMFLVGREFLGGYAEAELIESAHLWFATGLVLCAFVVTVAVERRMRWAAFVLGAGHGTLALVAWAVMV